MYLLFQPIFGVNIANQTGQTLANDPAPTNQMQSESYPSDDENMEESDTNVSPNILHNIEFILPGQAANLSDIEEENEEEEESEEEEEGESKESEEEGKKEEVEPQSGPSHANPFLRHRRHPLPVSQYLLPHDTRGVEELEPHRRRQELVAMEMGDLPAARGDGAASTSGAGRRSEFYATTWNECELDIRDSQVSRPRSRLQEIEDEIELLDFSLQRFGRIRRRRRRDIEEGGGGDLSEEEF